MIMSNSEIAPEDKKRSKGPNKFPMSEMDTRDPKLGIDGDTIRIHELLLNAQAFEQMIRLNHEAIAHITFILNKSQPASPGKIEIRWWKNGGRPGRDNIAEPIVTMFSDGRKPLKIKPTGLVGRASSSAGFKHNYDDTRLLLGYLEDLLSSRELLKKYSMVFGRSINRFKRTNHENLLAANAFGVNGIIGAIEKRVDMRNAERNANPDKYKVIPKERKNPLNLKRKAVPKIKS
jgi:hypothetical protein